MNKIQRSTIKSLFQRENGDVLIAKSSRDEFWELPGGSVEWAEQPEETLKRELIEEFAIHKFQIIKFLGMFSFTAKDKEAEWNFIVSVFLCKLKSNNFIISNEHEKVAWVKPQEINTYPMREGYYRIIKGLIV